MKVTTRVDLQRENRREWPDRAVSLKVSVVIENAGRGDAVAGSIDKALTGVRTLVRETLNGSS